MTTEAYFPTAFATRCVLLTALTQGLFGPFLIRIKGQSKSNIKVRLGQGLLSIRVRDLRRDAYSQN